MSKYIPPEKLTAEQIQAQLDERFARWDQISREGCADPAWPDGTNMNLVRNHIIYYYRLLAEKMAERTQFSLFDAGDETAQPRPVPPKVPEDYMVPGGKYADRFDGRYYP